MEAVTVAGKVYQIGALYEDDESGCLGILEGYSSDNGFMMAINGQELIFESIGLNCRDSGTITDAPLELEDGEWYMCEVEDSDERWASSLIFKDGLWYLRDGIDLPQIQPHYEVSVLYKMVKG